MRVFGVLTALASVFLSCSAQPDDIFFIQGRAVDDLGAAGMPVNVSLERTISARPAQDPCGWMAPYAELNSDESGFWSRELIRQDTVGLDGQPACFNVRLSYSDEALGNVEARFVFPSIDAILPAIPLWRSEVSLASSVSGTEVGFRPFTVDQAEAGGDYRFDVAPAHRVVLENGDGFVWVQDLPAGEDGWAFREFIPEDFASVGLRVDATYHARRPGIVGFVEDAVYEIRHSTKRIEVDSFHRLPLSRGGRCVIDGIDLEPCALTDGKLAPWYPPQGIAEEVAIHLGSRMTVSRVVIRGLRVGGVQASLYLDGSNDGGASWFEFASSALEVQRGSVFTPEGRLERFLVLEFPRIEVESVRVRFADYAGSAVVYQLSEVSVF